MSETSSKLLDIYFTPTVQRIVLCEFQKEKKNVDIKVFLGLDHT